jgi:outer membrane translocation and assembly module TamA
LTNITVRERGVFFQGNQEFAQVTLEVRWYQDVNPFQVFAFKVRGGVILDLGRFAEVPNIERFFGGGLNSVRGWGLNRLGPKDGSQEPIGGDSLLEGSVEFRFRFSHYFGGVLFLEAGNVAKEFDAFDLRDLKWAVGTGIRYLSPVGPVRFDLGIRLSEDGLEPKRVYHLSLGQAF